MSAREYHDKTSYQRQSLGGHFLDWGNQPSVLKQYPGLERVVLPAVTSWPEVKLSRLLAADLPRTAQEIDKTDLARILALSHSVTATTRHSGMEFHFRNAASAGALYPFELYVATGGVKGIDDGLFHHGIVPQSLTILRRGYLLREIRTAMNESSGHNRGLVFFLTSIFFRSAWKYRARSYRYDLLDTGHLLENLVLALRAAGLNCVVHYDFDDDRVNELLGVDRTREVCLAMVSANLRQDASPGNASTPGLLAEQIAAASRTAREETEYPEVRSIHSESSRIVSCRGRAVDMGEHHGLEPKAWEEVPELSPWPEIASYSDAVRTRRSSRNFVKHPMGRDCLDGLVDAVCASGDPCAPAEADLGSVHAGFLAASVEGLDSGFYLIDRTRRRIGRVRPGSLIEPMVQVCLGQEWLANCAAHLIFMTNPEALETIWGSRGYRYAMLTAGRLGQRIYLAATAMKLGCCGIGAFFDQEAATLLGLGQGSRMLYLLGVGHIRKSFT